MAASHVLLLHSGAYGAGEEGLEALGDDVEYICTLWRVGCTKGKVTAGFVINTDSLCMVAGQCVSSASSGASSKLLSLQSCHCIELRQHVWKQ